MTMPSTSSTTTTGSATRGESAPASAAAVIETATIARNEPASTSSKTLEDLDLCVVAHDEAVGLRQRRAASDLHVLADQARLDAVVEVAHLRAREHDRVLQLGALDPDILADRGVGADVGVGQLRAGADDRGSAHCAADQLGSRLDRHPPSKREAVSSPSSRSVRSSRISRLASSMSCTWPVSFHQPCTTCGSTRRPESTSDWMASVISSSPRALGSIDRAASNTLGVNM